MRERGWESPNSDEGTYTVVLFKYTYFVVKQHFRPRVYMFVQIQDPPDHLIQVTYKVRYITC